MLVPLTIANLKMIIRNRQALFWALAFPLIFVTVFGLFRLDEPPTIDLLVVDNSRDDMSRALIRNLGELERFHVEERDDAAVAREDVEGSAADYLLVIPRGITETLAEGNTEEPIGIELLYDRSSQSAGIIISTIRQFVEEVNKRATRAPTLLELRPKGVQVRQLNYFDFLLPGFVGMGVMTYSIIGLSATMAVYREQKILKRMLATPLKVRTFFASQIAAFLLLSVAQALIIIAAGVFIFGGHIYGNLGYVLLLVVVANIVFLNLGFIVGSFARNVRAADGMANAVAMPMMFLSGTFFPKESLPAILSDAVEYLPLSPLLDAMRGVALEAQPFWDYPDELAILLGWIVVSSVVAVRAFKFS